MKATTAILTLLFALVCAGATTASAAGGKRVTSASSVRVRATPSTSGTVVETLSIGVVLDEVGRSPAPQKVGSQEDYWYKVALPSGKQGWVFGGLTKAVDPNRLDTAYVEITRDRLANDVVALTFADWTDLVAFLDRAAGSVSSKEARGELEMARLVAVGNALMATPIEQQNRAPYKPWRDKLKTKVVYSEPAAQWLVEADEFWTVQSRYADTTVGDRLAWDAANASLPGECEGDVSCTLSAYNLTAGRYVKLYPKGQHTDEAIGRLVEIVEGALKDGQETGYYVPTEPEYQEPMRKDLAEARAAVSASSGARRDEALALIGQLDAKLK